MAYTVSSLVNVKKCIGNEMLATRIEFLMGTSGVCLIRVVSMLGETGVWNGGQQENINKVPEQNSQIMVCKTMHIKPNILVMLTECPFVKHWPFPVLNLLLT